MGIVGGFDVHRQQITFDLLDMETGQVSRGEIRPATRSGLRRWLERFEGSEDIAIAMEACTGWRFIVEELEAAGVEAHLAEVADTRALRGPKRRAKNDREDARHLRELLQNGRLPEAWIPPEPIQELRSLFRLRKTLVDERTSWQQRIQACLFHHGQPARPRLLTRDRRAWLQTLQLSPAARQQIEVALRMIDQLQEELQALDQQLLEKAHRLRGCQILTRELYGMGPFTALATLSELGNAARFSRSRQVVRYAGLDITVYQSDGKRSRGRLSRQGPELLRWALYEASISAHRPTSPDHAYFIDLSDRVGTNRARLSEARKLLRRAYHLLRPLGERAFEEEVA
jgi:transposase